MNLLDAHIRLYNISNGFKNWLNSNPTTDLIDSVTYNLYEDNNPFRNTFNSEQIENKKLRFAINTTTNIGAEVFSAFANPYYLTHKITHIPTYYKNAVDLYDEKTKNKVQLTKKD